MPINPVMRLNVYVLNQICELVGLQDETKIL